MAKKSTSYVCQSCGAHYGKWSGQCADCGEWNSLVEAPDVSMPHHKATKKTIASTPKTSNYAGALSGVMSLDEVGVTVETRMPTGIGEFDRVLGGGLVAGSVVLIGGDPGIGKSTILLQTATNMAASDSLAGSALYITGEESLSQVAMRAKRLGLPTDRLRVLAETNVDTICLALSTEQPAVVIIDSIQTLFTDAIQSAPGGVAQIRESAAILTRYAKQTGTALFLVGHVTKEGALAGPRVLEHMVDTVLYFEGESDSRFRMIRAVKNRFGAVNELGIFGMTDTGLKEVANPSAIFLSRYERPIAGSVVMVSREGTRPLLVEVQALVDDSHAQPRRMALGLDHQRLSMLLAVMHRHGGIHTSGQDVYVNVVGGVKVMETGSDLAVLLACASSLREKALPPRLAIFGEVGLSGEIRPVPNGQERLKEAMKHGFTHAIVPKANAPKSDSSQFKGIQVIAVDRLDDAIDRAFELFR
ncbi:DNA repair protein RadA [Moraxella bovoculi]|uniref:DNA repair protein RadA n=1 Tax=Moraxella bovoculi TaxID=386891 RepID=A0AAC8T7W5_9GAMM|nr:DNA repair protein RadA [Moraxella bovoculi]AKG07672.1 DNA repair protein RadA [Moraxella bovoculi]AKG09727.1 DNA repair protein RadA [Moraxella bovoculi]AKG11644.1 DNA repair protein RadA [Moraxella bovoculi]AKG13611.1 DNA repair protein RadA [Moraxella bovoculi]